MRYALLLNTKRARRLGQLFYISTIIQIVCTRKGFKILADYNFLVAVCTSFADFGTFAATHG